MPRDYTMETERHVYTTITPEQKEELDRICRETGLSIKKVVRALIGWAGQREVSELIDHGVNLPRWQ